MNKILYSPTEGTTGFWGLRLVPDKSAFHKTDGDNDHFLFDNTSYYAALESCKSNKLEIVNPEVLNTVSDMKGGLWFSGGNELQPGDIFDLPIGYEFKEERHCKKGSCMEMDGCYADGMHGEMCAAKTVLRLVKTETKEEASWQDVIDELERLKATVFLGDEDKTRIANMMIGLVIKRMNTPEKTLTFCPKCGELKYKGAEHACVVSQPETPALDKVFESVPKGKFDQHYKGESVKTETKEQCTCPDDQCQLGDHPTCRYKKTQPEPEESQTELWLEAREFMNVVSINGIPVLSMDENELLKRFKIFRKAQ